MGPERLKVGIGSWEKVYIPHLLCVAMFGCEHSIFFEFEGREFGSGGRKKLYHISSQKPIVDLFTVNDWCAVTVGGVVGRKTCCGRVNGIRMSGSRVLNKIGYVLDQSNNLLHVMLNVQI